MTTRVLDPVTVGRQAQEAAARAAAGAGVVVRPLDSLAELHRAAALFAAVWQANPEDAPVSAHLMRALEFTGSYVHGAYDAGGELLAASVGFLAAGQALHSHVSGVHPAAQGRGLGFALKLHQRAWSLERGITRISWTFDPLVRRNAAFNLAKLGARAVSYLPDFYGPMADGINAGEASDRLLVQWALEDPAVVAAADGAPAGPLAPGVARTPLVTEAPDGRPLSHPVQTSGLLTVAVPEDVAALRRETPEVAHQWRAAVRAALVGVLDAGGVILGVDPQRRYLLAPAQDA